MYVSEFTVGAITGGLIVFVTMFALAFALHKRSKS